MTENAIGNMLPPPDTNDLHHVENPSDEDKRMKMTCASTIVTTTIA